MATGKRLYDNAFPASDSGLQQPRPLTKLHINGSDSIDRPASPAPPSINIWRLKSLPHQYSIRLLKLHGGPFEAPLEGNLIIRNGKQEYEALSYTWGDEKESKPLRLINSDDVHVIMLTTNLEAALRHLRHPKTVRLLWIDALCIDQGNHQEKNKQVPRMATIYNEATNVCVWLGEEHNNSERALIFIKRVLDLAVLDGLTRDADSVRDWNALWNVMRRPWFSRRWVVQEIALARKATIHCGGSFVRWQDFANAVALFSSR